MRTRYLPGIAAMLCLSMAWAQSPVTATQREKLPDSASIVGIWRGKLDSLPAITLTIEEENGKLTGAVLFYLIRTEPGIPATATPGAPEPLIDPHFDGKTLVFKVSHQHAHPPGTLHDPPVSFRVEPAGADKCKLFVEGEPAVEMVRDTYQ
jgi:hypothetical protein